MKSTMPLNTPSERWFNVTMADGSKVLVQAVSKVEAVSRATADAIKSKQEWLVKSANPTQVQPVRQLARDHHPELEFAS